MQRAGSDPPESTPRVCALSRCLRAVAGLPPHGEPLRARTYSAPALSIRGISTGPAARPASSPTHRGPFGRPGFAKMSAKPDAGFVKEASRQILAGGSAGKVAPPRRGPVAFSFACPENFPQTSLPTEVSPLNSAPRAQRPSPPNGRAKEAGSGRRTPGARGQVPGAAALARPASRALAWKASGAAPRPATWRRPLCGAGCFA